MTPSRLDTLKKKASELSTLCGVDVCFLCFSPDGGGVLTWPEKEPEVRTIISRYTQQSKKRPLSTAPPPAKKQKRTRSSSPVAQSDDLLGLLNAKLSVIKEKIEGLERKKEVSWMDLNPSVRVCDSQIWRELEGIELGELGCVGEEGECSLSPEEIESWVSALAAEGEMEVMATQSNVAGSSTAFALTLNDDIGLSLEEIESWDQIMAPSSDLPRPSTSTSALSLNEQSGYFEKKNESPLCAQGYLILNEEIRDLVDASESRLCEEKQCDRELGDAQFWGAEQVWEFGEAETHMEKKRLSWDWNLLPIPIDC